MATRDNHHIAVVGAGLAGLAAACSLACKGYTVSVFESNSWNGGKAAILEIGGFRFDMGPTILTLPALLARIFREAGRNMEDYLTLVPLDPQWRSLFSDGSLLDLTADPTRMRENLEAFSPFPKDPKGYERFLDLSARLHDISRRYFFDKPIGGLRDMVASNGFFNPNAIKDMAALRMGKTVAGTVRNYVRDARLAQMMDHFTQYVGSAPDNSPAVLCGIADMQTSQGVWYPLGGTGAIPDALERLARELGVCFYNNSRVKKLRFIGKRVAGVELATGESWDCDGVVSNADVVRSCTDLFPEGHGGTLTGKSTYEPACSGVVLYLGLKRRYEHLRHHNFVFSADPEAEFRSIYKDGEPAEDPTCYLCAPAQTDPSVAPNGGEALYVLVHTPYLRRHHNWEKLFPRYRQIILEKLATTGGMPDLKKEITTESYLTPQDIHERYRVYKGAIYGIASHGRFLGAFKPSNDSTDTRGLYFAGGSVHPGPGMPMVLMSGWIAANCIDRDFNSRSGS